MQRLNNAKIVSCKAVFKIWQINNNIQRNQFWTMNWKALSCSKCQSWLDRHSQGHSTDTRWSLNGQSTVTWTDINRRSLNGPLSVHSTHNRQSFNGQSTVTQRTIDGHWTDNRRSFNGQSTVNQRTIDGRLKDIRRSPQRTIGGHSTDNDGHSTDTRSILDGHSSRSIGELNNYINLLLIWRNGKMQHTSSKKLPN